VGWARADVTQGHIYSISETTRNYLAQLQEPLLLRGYFSARTHPLLAPLVPRLRDLLEEYEIAGKGRVRVEFVDPQEHPELEQEANEKYAIKPVPFQFESKYQSSVVNSYFNILVQYGDQYQVLDFRDLIDIKVRSETDLEVDLRNPEYDITQAIKKVLYAYQSAGELFENISQPLTFKGYISANDKLPEVLRKFRQELDNELQTLSKQANGKLKVEIQDPEAGDGALAKRLQSDYGFGPMAASLFDTNTFWFYMTLEGNGRVVEIPLPEEFDKAGLERGLQAVLKRFSKGFLKTLALVTPKASPDMAQFGLPAAGQRFTTLHDTLAEEHNVIETDLSNGQVPPDADLLVLVAPQQLDEKQLFAVDQFLMRGGSVILSTSPFDIDTRDKLSARAHRSGLQEWLAHNGIDLQKSLVLDPQNAAFPIPVERDLGGFVVQETQLVDYPFFVDVRQDGLDQTSGLTAGLDQVTLTWPSPITLDQKQLQDRRVIRLVQSTDQAWTTENLDIQPDYQAYGKLGFPAGDERSRELLAVAVEGRFESYFKDKPSPLATEEEAKPQTEQNAPEAQKDQAETPKQPIITRVIDHSPESARIILFASNSFLTDQMLDLATAGLGTHYTKPVDLVENAIDWSLEDQGLLAIRGRTQFSRTLAPLGREAQMFWEYLNYALVLLGLALIWLLRRQHERQARLRYAEILGQVA
jgi:ABC-2 type transport system permease protein